MTRIEDKVYKNIQERTFAILFMATPHRGSGSADYASISTKILSGTLPKPLGSIRSDLIKALRRDSKDLVNIGTEFKYFTSVVRIYSFIEKTGTSYTGSRVSEYVWHPYTEEER